MCNFNQINGERGFVVGDNDFCMCNILNKINYCLWNKSLVGSLMHFALISIIELLHSQTSIPNHLL